MKQLITVGILAAALFLPLSCGSVDLSRRYPNMIADVDPFPVGTIEAQLDRLFSSDLTRLEAEVVFHPRLNAVALVFRYQTVNYRQFWDENSRRLFAEALESYKTAFSERNLANNYRRTRAAYGQTRGRVEWDTFRFSKTYISFPAIEIGYRFRQESPFFATLMRSAKDESDSGSGSSSVENQQISMYFTRAQADELVKLFDQSFLLGQIDRNLYPARATDQSIYFEYEYEEEQPD
ncbi:MAG: hypothetical protein FWG89_06690 [Treponema sp.]|nr:hypothetical protein [Treponema sp.]